MNVYFYIETIASITCSVIVTNFFVSVIDSKYKKYVSFIWLFFICNLITLINLYGIKKIGLGVVDGMIFKFVMNTVFFVTTIYFLCNKVFPIRERINKGILQLKSEKIIDKNISIQIETEPIHSV